MTDVFFLLYQFSIVITTTNSELSGFLNLHVALKAALNLMYSKDSIKVDLFPYRVQIYDMFFHWKLKHCLTFYTDKAVAFQPWTRHDFQQESRGLQSAGSACVEITNDERKLEKKMYFHK